MDTFDSYKRELENILQYWSSVVFDKDRDRFYGKVDEDNHPDEHAPLGAVMYSRILWSFSAAYQLVPDPRYLEMAQKAYNYLITAFSDEVYGGVFWTIDSNGNPDEDKKQIYALAFAIYGLSEFYRINPQKKAVEQAIALYELIEKYSYDPIKEGYLEAFNKDWSLADDLRLSKKDSNEKKTMNTHLHIMEAYVNLYKIWPDENLANKIKNIIHIFSKYIIDPQTNHLGLFFDENWKSKSNIVSYGHDIEASWLLCEAAEILKDEILLFNIREQAIKITRAVAEILTEDGGLNYEYEPDQGHLFTDKHWWVQAEASVGFLNAWQISGDRYYFTLFEKSWNFIDRHIIDKVNGEWFWGIDNNHQLMPKQDKAGIWKCPYHNTRCILEIINRLVTN